MMPPQETPAAPAAATIQDLADMIGDMAGRGWTEAEIGDMAAEMAHKERADASRAASDESEIINGDSLLRG